MESERCWGDDVLDLSRIKGDDDDVQRDSENLSHFSITNCSCLTDEKDGRTTPHNSPSPPPSRPLSSLTPSSLPPSLPSPSPSACPATSTYFTDVMVTYVALRGATLDDDERARAARVKFTFGHEGEG